MGRNLGVTLYEAMLRDQQAKAADFRAQQQAQREYDQQMPERVSKLLNEGEARKKSEFERKARLAEMGGQAAAAQGLDIPQFEDPAVQEHANMAALAGMGAFKQRQDAAQAAKDAADRALGEKLMLQGIGAYHDREKEISVKTLAEETAEKNRQQRLELAKFNNNAAMQRAQVMAGAAKDRAVTQGESNLRKEVTSSSLYKDMQTADTAYQSLLRASKTGPGTMSMLFSYLKGLDPNSTVRESEYANAQNAGGIPDSLRGIWNKIVGAGRLSEPLRQEFIREAGMLAKIRRDKFTEFAKFYEELAAKKNYDATTIVPASGLAETYDGATEDTSPSVDDLENMYGNR